MRNELPGTTAELLQADWSTFEPEYRDLAAQTLAAENVAGWLSRWSRASELVAELYNRLYVATTVNTADAEAEKRYQHFTEQIYPQASEADQGLKEKLIASGLCPPGFEIPLRNYRAEADLYRAENLPLISEEFQLSNEYFKITGAQTVTWEGKETTLQQLNPVAEDPDRQRREAAWRLSIERQLADREALNALWQKLLDLRLRMAANTGRDYRAFRTQQLLRFDYTPADCHKFHQAIEETVVPAAQRIYERRRRLLGVDRLRPWDVSVDPYGRPALHPFQDVAGLKRGVSAIFHHVDPVLGGYFDSMVSEELLDLDNRKNKGPGGYCNGFDAVRKPFIFMNAVGTHDDVQTLLHEGGHAFHVFESAHLPYHAQLSVPMEFAEVASMGMELLAGPYLAHDYGGFYTPQEAARARASHLEGILLFWPYMAVVDAFQHWVYENPSQAMQPNACDAAWGDLWGRFMPGVDWSGFEDAMLTGWHRNLHIFEVPFYYVEYGLAQLGAVQVWRNALEDQAGAVARYRPALSLGGTVTLPQLYAAAGARLAFDAPMLWDAVQLLEEKMAGFEALAEGA
ncbi:MAG: M3 family oligoendopeptidase [Anaerolineaceae bacterium]|nr:M3 family oligoendopeptidase [Anaerolineaceae bacterium]